MTKFTFKLTVTCVMLGYILFGAGKANAAELPKDANTTCPVMLKEEVDPDLHVDYKGRRIYMCCTKCKRRFLNDPEKYLKNLPPPSDEVTSATGKPKTSPKK